MKLFPMVITAGLLCLSCTKGTENSGISYNAACNFVYEFMPAPGQFINDYPGYSITSGSQACQYALEHLNNDQVISLGAFGGYIIVGFDHSIQNSSGYDIAIKSNPILEFSEPGIVWVMKDSNGDGLPNDTWYELMGSEFGCKGTYYDYTVTYYCPTDSGQDVKWKDNYGKTGAVKYLGTYHKQPSYYPLWASADSLVLTGTLLRNNSANMGTVQDYWVCNSFEYGYVDNYSSVDYSNGYNYFDIDNAVDRNLEHVDLDIIDFVKVQTAVLAQCGWVGEVSTEISKIVDAHLDKSIKQ
ncbi:MAG: hypothetical protein MJY71_03500 [Bacteroidaceae bacterium]|nr:hypothetical protein [Bacteroidaceae bacterium]